MIFQVDREALAEAVSWTARSLPSRPAVPILSGVKIVVEEQTLTLSSFDYEVSAKVVIPVEMEQGGQAVVSGKMLADISRSLPGQFVDIAMEGSKLSIKSGSSHFHLTSMPVENFPELPKYPPLAGQIDSEVFAQAVNKVAIAASRDDTLPLLTGVRLEFEDNHISFLATDRYRLAINQVPWHPTDLEGSTNALVKAKTLIEVAKSMTSGGSVSLALDTQQASLIGFEVGGRTITSQLNDGDYPPVRQLFPEKINLYAVVSTPALIDAVKRVSLVGGANAQVKMSFTEGNLALECSQGGDYRAGEDLPAHLEGEDISVSFNPRYLLEGLGVLDTAYMRISFVEASLPAVITGQTEIGAPDQQDYKYLIMPIRVV